MKQETFLKALEKSLGRLKKSERIKYVESYRELLADLMENGFSEEDAVAKQGDVKVIAAEILAGAAQEEKKKELGGVLLLAASAVMIVLSAAALFNDWIVSRILTAVFNFGSAESSSIGIIGGADGPTAIFVASSPSDSWLICIPTIIVVAVTIWHFVRKRNKK